MWNCKRWSAFLKCLRLVYFWLHFSKLCTNLQFGWTLALWMCLTFALPLTHSHTHAYTHTRSSSESASSSFPLDLSSYLVFYSASPPTVCDIDCHNKTIILPSSLNSSSTCGLITPVYCPLLLHKGIPLSVLKSYVLSIVLIPGVQTQPHRLISAWRF